MLDRVFPRTAGNDFQGHPAALWCFGFFTLVFLGRSLMYILLADGGAQLSGTVPLDTFTDDGAGAVVLFVALWGVSQLLLGFVFVAVLWRYRNLVPLMAVLIILQQVGRWAIVQWKLMETVSTPFSLQTPDGESPGVFFGNLVWPAAGLVILVLAMRRR